MTTAPAPDRVDEDSARFLAELEAAAHDGRLVRLVLSKPRGAEAGLQRIAVRPLVLRGQACLSFLYRYATRDVTKQLPLAAGIEALRGLVGSAFGDAHLETAAASWQLLSSRKGHATLRRSARVVPEGEGAGEPARAQGEATSPDATGETGCEAAEETIGETGREAFDPTALPGAGSAPPDDATPARPGPHDRAKHRYIDLRRPFLAALGVTDEAHRLIPAMARKWKQINKFVEILDHALEAGGLRQGAAPLRVADFGSGKGYLTFAVHDYLQTVLGRAVQVTGVEQRPDMVALCSDATRSLGLDGLAFEQGDVRSAGPQALDVMIALHACDTATDHAMHRGIRAGAAVILCAPCCHRQIRPQLTVPHPLRPMLRHGIHLGQEAEMLTDALRALLLEAQGYDTQVFEFVSLEHTAKNKMILAVKRRQPRPAAPLWAQVREIKSFYGIEVHCLESLLAAAPDPA